MTRIIRTTHLSNVSPNWTGLSARRWVALSTAPRLSPPAKRPHIDSETNHLGFSEFTALHLEQTENSSACFYSRFVAEDFDFEFCVEDRSFPVHSARVAASSDVLGAMIRWARTTSNDTYATLTLVPAFVFESIIHQIYNCDYSCPTIMSMLWPLDQDTKTDYQHPNEIQRGGLQNSRFLSVTVQKL